MPKPFCPKCSNTRFIAKAYEVENARHPVTFIQCRGCGFPVGTQEYFSSGDLVLQLARKLGFKLE